MTEPKLKMCRRSNDTYQEIRDQHYVENHGTQGQQVHFLVNQQDTCVGIISGASSMYAVKNRDKFFGIPPNTENEQVEINGEEITAKEARTKYYLSAIVTNTVFRLEHDRMIEYDENFGTKTLSLWRDMTAYWWEEIYDIPVIGFETFIVKNEDIGRTGGMYKADNWTYVGTTEGRAKRKHHGMGGKQEREDVVEKMVFCRWRNMNEQTPTTRYQSSWRRETEEEKQRRRWLQKVRAAIPGIEIMPFSTI